MIGNNKEFILVGIRVENIIKISIFCRQKEGFYEDLNHSVFAQILKLK